MMLAQQALEMVVEWRPQDVLFALALVIIGGKQLWPYIFRTKVNGVPKSVDRDAEASDVVLRKAEEIREAIIAKDEQGRLRLHGWAVQDAVNRQSASTAAALEAVTRSLIDLSSKIHKQSNVQQNTNGLIDRIDLKVDRIEGHLTGQNSERRLP